MRFSQVSILLGMTFAGLVAVGTLPLAAVNTQESCLARPWLSIIPLNLMFGLLFGKTWRIWWVGWVGLGWLGLLVPAG